MRVLFVDDEPAFLEQAEIFLEKEVDDVSVETVTSADDALDLLDENDYDCVVSDYQMPEMDGLEFLETLREEWGNDIPFIMFTGKGREKVAMEALNLGADRYLQKGGSPKSQFGVLAQAVVQEVEHRRTGRRARELEALRSTVRRVNQVLTKSRNMKEASKEICEILLDTKGYLDISMVLEEDDAVKPVASCGNHERKSWEARLGSGPDLESQDIPECFKRVLETGEELIIDSKRNSDHCVHCEFCLYEDDHSSVKLPIDLKNRTAVLTLCLRVGRLDDKELKLLREVADDIQAGFRRMEMGEELERYEKIVEETRDSICLVDSNGNFKFVNKAVQDRLGYDEEDLIGRNFFDFVHPEDKERLEGMFNTFIEKGGDPKEIEFRLKTSDGSYIWKESHGRFMPDEETILVTSRDINDQKEYEKELKRKDRYLDHIPEFIQVIDEQGNVKYRSQDLLGENIINSEEIIDSSILDFVHPEDMGKAQETFFKVLENPGEEYRIEIRGKTEDGWKWFEGSMVNYLDKPEIEGIIVTGRDISKRKDSEEREEFLHSLLRHDVGNKAQIIRGYLELFKDYDLSEELEEYLSKAEKAVQDSVALIEKVRTLREIGEEEELRQINVDTIIKKVLIVVEAQAEENDIEIQYDEIDCKVKAGPLLEELFSNLVENSIIHSGCNEIRISGRATDGECIVTVEDGGCGLPEEERNKIFEKGYTSGKNSGSGLGMYLVKEIAENYGGSVEIKDSELGGARFDIHLKKANKTN